MLSVSALEDSINGEFYIENGTFFLNDIVSSHKNLKLKTLGNFSFLNDQIFFENRINVNTKDPFDWPRSTRLKVINPKPVVANFLLFKKCPI